MSDKKLNEYQSFGAGVNSVALAEVLNHKPEKIFADTGCEYPETYEYLNNYPYSVTILKTSIQGFENLLDYCIYYKTIPLRQFRWCTSKFKKNRIDKYIIKKNSEGDIIQYLGIAYDEKHRAKIKKRGRFNYYYPLVEQRIDRKQCIEIIKEANLVIPPKSGCYICPFQRKDNWIQLLKIHPDLFQIALNLEKGRKKAFLYPKGLKWIKGRFESGLEQKTLWKRDEDDNWECQFCIII